MNPIHWLRLLRKAKTNIDGHYILKIENKFLVFTSNPVSGIKCHKVSDTNIKGENKPQFIAEHVHTIDVSMHKLTQPNECKVYYNENKKELLSHEQKLKLISEITDK